MSSNCLKVLPYNYSSETKAKKNGLSSIGAPNNSANISFQGRHSRFFSNFINQDLLAPKVKKAVLGTLDNLYERDIINFDKFCYEHKISRADAFAMMIGAKKYLPKVEPMPSVTHKILKSNIEATSLMDGGQIFKRTIEDINSAKKSIQIKMFEFQNVTVDGDDWKPKGAENVPGYDEQRQLLERLITKKRTNPDMKIQVMLDVHKWGINSDGKKKHYNNQKMIMFLKKQGIDVVPSPRDSILHHDKYMIVDGKKAIIGGMNWGTHSPANHDFCFALKNIDERKNSEIDNLVQDFNTNWRFAWYRIGTKKLVAGPLNEAEQKLYKGIGKEIKDENVQYYNYVHEFYETPEALNRYKENRLDLVECNPIKNPFIKFLDTKPKELEEIGEKGSEAALEHVMGEVKTSKDIFGELFYFTDDEIIDTIIKRVKSGDLNAKFIMHEMEFPYCKRAYFKLVENGIDVRQYKEDKSIDQRMHAKWVVFDNKRVMVGSPNWSRRALRQNLSTGLRGDTPLTTENIEGKIQTLVSEVKSFESKLQLPHVEWDGSSESYLKLKKARRFLKTVFNQLHENGEASFKLKGKEYVFKSDDNFVTVDGVKYPFKEKDDRNTEDILAKIKGIYGNIYEKQHAKEKYKRGNNESAILVNSASFVRDVFKPQFIRDWNHSESLYLKQNLKKAEYIPPKPFNVEG